MRYTINGRGLNLAERGEGKQALLLLHYFGGSSRTWGPVMDLLAGDFRCLALDLTGWGDSDAAGAYTVADMADDALGIAAALGLTRYTLVGHSMGGKAAQALAARQPPGLESLLLVAPSPLSPGPMTTEGRADLRAAWGSEAAARATLAHIARLPLPPELAEQTIADNLRGARAAWEAWPDGGSREDLSALASEIAVPTHILAGERDPVMSPDLLRYAVQARILGATLAVAPGMGHLLPLEDADGVAGWVREMMGGG
jgi:3-oxoadipate enol-lactonase